MHEPKITLRLPEDSYESMKLNCISSDIAIEDLEIGKLEIESTSGDMNLHRLKMNSAELKTISGDISIQDSTAKDKISIDSTSGDVKMENCDADLFRTLTTSGDIEALLQTGKACTIETVSGSICLPEDIPELGSFHAETVSGDVHVRVK